MNKSMYRNNKKISKLITNYTCTPIKIKYNKQDIFYIIFKNCFVKYGHINCKYQRIKTIALLIMPYLAIKTTIAVVEICLQK